MVGLFSLIWVPEDNFWLVAQENLSPDPITRTAALMALLGIALLGLLIVVGILLGGHWVRRLGKYRRAPAVPPDVLPHQPRPSSSSKTLPNNFDPSKKLSAEDTKDL